MNNIVQASLVSLAAGFMLNLVQQWAKTDFLIKFLEGNLITILVAVLAINAGTMGTILTKVRDLIDNHKVDAKNFANTRSALLCSIKEQIVLVVVGLLALMFRQSEHLKAVENLPLMVDSIIVGTFVYSLIVLYDTARGVLIIVDFKSEQDE